MVAGVEQGNGQATGMMARERLYFDYNATAPLLTAARSAMVDAMDLPGNPSSVHAEGRKARAVIGSAREAVARLCDVPAAQVVFCSGATEAANHVLTPDYLMGRSPVRVSRLLVSAVEHPAMLSGGRFAGGPGHGASVDATGGSISRRWKRLSPRMTRQAGRRCWRCNWPTTRPA
jgi:cysteine desulfurase